MAGSGSPSLPYFLRCRVLPEFLQHSSRAKCVTVPKRVPNRSRFFYNRRHGCAAESVPPVPKLELGATTAGDGPALQPDTSGGRSASTHAGCVTPDTPPDVKSTRSVQRTPRKLDCDGEVQLSERASAVAHWLLSLYGANPGRSLLEPYAAPTYPPESP